MRSRQSGMDTREQRLADDALHHAALRLASGRLPEGYLNDALRERLCGYEADDDARERLGARADDWVQAAIAAAGNLTEARRRYEGNAEDGMQFALIRGLRSRRDVKAYRIGNPAFRARYDDDLAFQHGVEAGVWANRE